MPGHTPAGTTPPCTPSPSRATVVHLNHHRRRDRREEPPMHGPHPRRDDPPSSGPADPAAALLAEHVQALYLHRGQSLADPETAAAYDTALELAVSMVDAVAAQGHRGEEALDRLRHMMTAARRVPDSL